MGGGGGGGGGGGWGGGGGDRSYIWRGPFLMGAPGHVPSLPWPKIGSAPGGTRSGFFRQ